MLRDAQGNVLAIYQKKDNNFVWKEQHLYGPSRLGIWKAETRIQGTYKLNVAAMEQSVREYELTNHLGNVLSTLTDKGVITSAQDYFPFGLTLASRSFTEGGSSYRYSFNGKEDDKGLKQQDYGFRLYRPDLGRFPTVDPLTKKYPWYSPYQFAGNMPIKYVDLDGLEPAENPKIPTNQGDRNPVSTINTIYDLSGGDTNFEQNFQTYAKGTYSASATVSGISNKPGYTSDSKDGASKYNLWVNNTGVFKAQDYPNYDAKDFSNFLIGCMIKGVGPENIEFPTNGTVSNELKGAGIVNDALNSWYTLNKGQNALVAGQAEFSGNKYSPGSLVGNGMFHPETFLGSATVMIAPLNEKEILVKIFNVTSLVSGDLSKHLPWNAYSKGVVRDPSQPSSSGANQYGNISQTYSFTLPIDSAKLKQ